MRRIPRTIVPLLLALGSVSPGQPLLLEYSFGAFRDARRLSVDQRHWIYVVDAETHSVSRYSMDGTVSGSIGGQGWRQNQFDSPKGLDAHFGLEVYVADYGNHRIERYDGNLNYIGSLATRDDPRESSRFGYPLDVAISRQGDLYIVDSENVRIVKVMSFSTVERTFGSIEAREGQLRQPIRIAVGPDDNVSVLEPDRVVVFDPFGTFLRQIPFASTDPARGFCIRDTELYIITDNDCMIYSLQGEMKRHIRRSECIGLIDTGAFVDIAVTEDRCFILTATSVHVFPKPQ